MGGTPQFEPNPQFGIRFAHHEQCIFLSALLFMMSETNAKLGIWFKLRSAAH
jgi:hypothetical protein